MDNILNFKYTYKTNSKAFPYTCYIVTEYHKGTEVSEGRIIASFNIEGEAKEYCEFRNSKNE